MNLQKTKHIVENERGKQEGDYIEYTELVSDREDEVLYFDEYEELKRELMAMMRDHDLTAYFYHLAQHTGRGGGKWYLQHSAKFDGNLEPYMRGFFLDRDSNARVTIKGAPDRAPSLTETRAK